jgi:hypothetical protein
MREEHTCVAWSPGDFQVKNFSIFQPIPAGTEDNYFLPLFCPSQNLMHVDV